MNLWWAVYEDLRIHAQYVPITKKDIKELETSGKKIIKIMKWENAYTPKAKYREIKIEEIK